MGEPMPVWTLAERQQKWNQFLRERGQRIREARLRKRISREQLAELLHVSPGSIGNWERGNCALFPHHLSGLADALEVSPEYLQGEEVPEEPEVMTEPDDLAESFDDESIPDAIERCRLRVAAVARVVPSRVRVIIEFV
jgi:transcriptional regulator with XRE-family HTH domain